MTTLTDLTTRIQILDRAVVASAEMPNSSFREALCELIRSIPQDWESEARALCLDEDCPFGASVIEHLQRDIDAHADDLNYTLIFYPLMRLAVAIRTAELRFSPQ
jgi:hypothetical protein